MWVDDNNMVYLVLTADDDTVISASFNRKLAEMKITEYKERWPTESFWVMPIRVCY